MILAAATLALILTGLAVVAWRQRGRRTGVTRYARGRAASVGPSPTPYGRGRRTP